MKGSGWRDGRALLMTAMLAGMTMLAAAGSDAAEHARKLPRLAEAKMAYVDFRYSPFPYRGIIPDKNVPFLDAVDGMRRGHTSPRAQTVYWEDQTYSNRQTLIYFPAGFDIEKPAVILVFFHGNGATLPRDVVDRQQVPEQLAESGLNAVLVAPQFALDAVDSSAGNFWTPGVFARFLDEAAGKIARVYGRDDTRGKFAGMPVVILAYSGGYDPVAYALDVGGANKRIRGVLLLDALYAEEDKFAHWLARNRKSVFFFSAYTKSAAASNATLQEILSYQRVKFSTEQPARLQAGNICFFATDPELVHDDLVTHAWVDDPVRWLLARVSGYRRSGLETPHKVNPAKGIRRHYAIIECVVFGLEC